MQEFHASFLEAYTVYTLQNSQNRRKTWIPGGEMEWDGEITSIMFK